MNKATLVNINTGLRGIDQGVHTITLGINNLNMRDGYTRHSMPRTRMEVINKVKEITMLVNDIDQLLDKKFKEHGIKWSSSQQQ